MAIHRADCINFRQIAARSPERVIAVAWGERKGESAAVYPVDVAVEANDRQGLLRDITEVFAKEKVNVTGVKTQSIGRARRDRGMTFTVEVGDASRLAQVLAQVARVAGRALGAAALTSAEAGARARYTAQLSRRVAQLVRAPP